MLSSPYTFLSRWMAQSFLPISVPPGMKRPLIVSPEGGTTLGIIPVVTGKMRAPSLSTAWRYGRVLDWASLMTELGYRVRINLGLQFLIYVWVGHDVKHGRPELGGCGVASGNAVSTSHHTDFDQLKGGINSHLKRGLSYSLLLWDAMTYK
jgi:hypothetical protein